MKICRRKFCRLLSGSYRVKANHKVRDQTEINTLVFSVPIYHQIPAFPMRRRTYLCGFSGFEESLVWFRFVYVPICFAGRSNFNFETFILEFK